MSTLEVRGLGHRYPGAPEPALRGVSLAVPEGQMVSVIGPSGSGKSTLLRVVAGLERGTGEVLLDGHEVGSVPTERRDLTVMFQRPLLFDHLDVAGNVAFAPRLAGAGRREARRRARGYLRLVHLEGFEARDIASLSGGQQQRVALARALAAERGALLLDEPFSSLDRELRASMHDLLAEVRAALEPTILLVTHDLDEAGLADSTVVLIEGRVHQQAPLAQLYRQPATLAVARLLGGCTEVRGEVRDGVHHSAWGRIPVSAEVTARGSAILLLRREALQLTPTDPGTDDAAGSGGAAAAGRTARVEARRQVGTRVVARLHTDDGSGAEVELPVGDDVRAGQRVRIAWSGALGPAWAVPLEPGRDEAADPTPAVHEGSGSADDAGTRVR